MQELKAGFSDKWLEDQIAVMKTLSTIQCRDASPLTEEGYKTEAALLNAVLIHQLSNWELIYSPKKIVGYLTQLDALVERGDSLVLGGNSINRLRGFVKSLLYSRVGDYLLSKLVTGDSDVDLRDNHILRCAMLAYQWALVHLFENGEVAGADFALNDIETAFMLHSNAKLVRSPTRHGVSHRGFMHLLSTSTTMLSAKACEFSFLSRDIESSLDNSPAVPSHCDVVPSISIAWSMRNGAHFLSRLSWILAFGHEACGLFTFLDENWKHMKRFSANLDEPCSPEALTVLDIKVFLFRTALHVEARGDGITFPWTLSPKPSSLQHSVWEAMVAVADSHRLELSSVVALTNAIEELRLLMQSQSDKSHLLRILCFLAALSCLEMTSADERKAYYELGTRYAQSILQKVEMGATVTNGSLLRRRILFPSTANEGSAIASDAEMCRIARDFIERKSIPNLTVARPSRHPRPPPPMESPTNGAAANGTLENSHVMTDDESMANLSFKSAQSSSPMVSPRRGQSIPQRGDEEGASADGTATPPNTTKETDRSQCSSSGHEEAQELRGLISRFTHHNSLLAKLISSTQQLSLSLYSAKPFGEEEDDDLAGTLDDGNSMDYSEKLWSISANAGSSQADPQWDTAIIPSPTRPSSKQAGVRQSLENLHAGTFEHVRFLQNPRRKQVDCRVKFRRTADGLHSLNISFGQDTEVEYVMDEGSYFQVVSMTTLRLLDLKRDGDEESPILLTFSAETGQHSAFKDLLYKAGQMEK